MRFDLIDHFGMVQANVVAMHKQFGRDPFPMRARIRDDSIARAGTGRGMQVREDRVGKDRRIDFLVAEGHQEGVSRGELIDARRDLFSECGCEKFGLVACQQHFASPPKVA